MKLVQSFDYKTTKLVDGLPPSIKSLMGGLSFMGQPSVVLLVGLAVYLSALRRDQPLVQRAMLYAAVAYGLSTLLKLIMHRRRPHDLDVRTLGVKSYSFPSGHAFGSMIIYGLFAYMDFKYLTRPWNIVIGGLLGLLILLIGGSRVYLKAHYPSDVVGGWILGFISLVIVILAAF